MGSSQTRARTCVPCIGRRILNHCATREAPKDIFLIVSFEGQKFLILTKCNLSVLSFLAYAFGVKSKKPLPNPVLWIFVSVFSSKSFIALALTFRSYIPFWVNFCIWCEVGVQLHFFACGYLVVLAPFAKEIVLSLLSCFGILVKNQLTVNVSAYFWILTSIPIDLYIYPY